MPATSGPLGLFDLSGSATAATFSITATSTTVSVLAFNNPANIGDFALLFNDGSQIGTTVQGGSRTYQFNGLFNGLYNIYTYGSPPAGQAGELLVNVLGSAEGTLMTSGPITPNIFTLGVTHVMHSVNVLGGSITIQMTDNPGSPPAYVSGFQLVLVPAPPPLVLFAGAILVRRRRRDSD